VTVLEARNITFSYESGKKVLDSLDFRVKPGEIVVVTGPTGSGKSTLAKCLTGFIPESIHGEFSGSVVSDDTDISELQLAEIAKQVALVQQDPESQICTLEVSDEVAFGPENYGIDSDEIQSRVESSLTAVGSGHLASRRTFELSGGEKQRLIIASMIISKPKYLIMDEPTSSLDPTGVLQLRTILEELKNQDKGIVLIEHNLSAVQPIADRVLVVEEGKIHPFEPKTVTKTTKSPKSEEIGDKIISTKDLSFSYGDRRVLENVHLSVNSGEVIGLMGSNGSGKTTLLGLLGGLLTPETGSIYLKNSSLESMSAKDIARFTSIVFQNPNHQIFEKTVWREQNLALKSLDLITPDTLQRSETLLKNAGIEEMKENNPFSLSHGQKRRLNVSSSIAHGPKLLLLDEPFIGQDWEGCEFIIETVSKTVQDGGAAIIITHDPVFVRDYCSRTIFMKDGAIFLDGTPSVVLERLESLGHQEYSMEVKLR
jgi:energy-coupling factor transport system ATP-binding protein